MKQTIYLDNNSTTMMTQSTIKALVEWCNMGNPSSLYPSAVKSKNMITDLAARIGKILGVEICFGEQSCWSADAKDNLDAFSIAFTSGASEANCTIIHSAASAYKLYTGRKPNIVISSIEHKSIIETVESLEAQGIITMTVVPVLLSGHINILALRAALSNDTCLVCCMHANNETGAINNIEAISEIVRPLGIPLYSDTVQTFGKFPPDMNLIDGCCISFHKFNGPPGVGALILRKSFAKLYRLRPMIYGSQNGAFRGGTENTPGLGASLKALTITFTDRNTKNKRLLALKNRTMDLIAKKIPTCNYIEYTSKRDKLYEVEVVFINGRGPDYLPNTILLSVIKRTKPYICNVKIKEDLLSKGVIISVGSACNTSSAKASHILYAMGADELIRKGALRISFGDYSEDNYPELFAGLFVEVIKKYMAH